MQPSFTGTQVVTDSNGKPLNAKRTMDPQWQGPVVQGIVVAYWPDCRFVVLQNGDGEFVVFVSSLKRQFSESERSGT